MCTFGLSDCRVRAPAARSGGASTFGLGFRSLGFRGLGFFIDWENLVKTLKNKIRSKSSRSKSWPKSVLVGPRHVVDFCYSALSDLSSLIHFPCYSVCELFDLSFVLSNFNVNFFLWMSHVLPHSWRPWISLLTCKLLLPYQIEHVFFRAKICFFNFIDDPFSTRWHCVDVGVVF